jgi:hypothetical protein
LRRLLLKLNNTFLLINSGSISKTVDWEASYAAIETAINRVCWPVGNQSGLTIPKIADIKPGGKFINLLGREETWSGGAKKKRKVLRNGVVPLRQMFRTNLEASNWRAEEPLSLLSYFEKIRSDNQLGQIVRYPIPPEGTVHEILHEGVGDFDFWLRSETGFRAVVEWETGNISSSHRSLNKMCLALLGGLVDAAVLIVPSFNLYPHLTDRIGNVKELQPYFYFWGRIGESVKSGLLAVIEVEHNKLFESTDMRDFIPRGTDGNAFRASRQKTRSLKVRKRANPPK